jgi:aminodeoxyfutalosine deaminase
MHYLSADLIFPVTGKPVRNSVLVLDDNGTVEGLFDINETGIEKGQIQHYNGILCPGFVNAHCHLELSWLKGLIAEGKGLDYFLRRLEELKPSVLETDIREAISHAAERMGKSGIVATADISNSAATLAFKGQSKTYFHTFVEVFGSNPKYAGVIFEKALMLLAQFKNQQSNHSASVTPHATYSVSDELFRLIFSLKDSILSIHHQENEDENRFFDNGSGLIAERRKHFNPDLPPFAGYGKRPMESILHQFDPDQKILLVHNTMSEQQDIEFVNEYFKFPYWCLCPNANLYIENRLPQIGLFVTNKCKVTLGTDSLASNHQLNILEEIKTIQTHFPGIQLEELISWSTLNGAEFLGLDHKLGSFEKGKNPGVVMIKNADLLNKKLTKESISQLIISARQ